MPARRRSRKARRPRRRRRAAVTPRPRAEALLLDLARELAVRTANATDVAAILDGVAPAYVTDAPLARALREAPRDKAARLALAWAREQVRLALVDLLHRARAAHRLRPDGDVETLAWLCLAACEALAYEAEGAAPDRVHALRTFLTGE